jgi:signal transduction histidine kinase/CheY-like chemotaxis protein/AraC-like DNA-binding protein
MKIFLAYLLVLCCLAQLTARQGPKAIHLEGATYNQGEAFSEPDDKAPFKGNSIPLSSIVVDEAGVFSPETVMASWFDLQPESSEQLTVEQGKTYWAVLNLTGNTPFPTTMLVHQSPKLGHDEYGFKHIDAYRWDEQDSLIHQQTGYGIPEAGKPHRHWANLLTVPLAAGDTVTLLVRLSGANPRMMPSIIRFWHIDPVSLADRQTTEAFRAGAFYGILIVQFLFFLLLFAIERERIHLYFSILCLGILMMFGFSRANYASLVPFPTWAEWTIPLTYIGYIFSQCGQLYFTKSYFRYPEDSWLSRFILPGFVIVSVVLNLYMAYNVEVIYPNGRNEVAMHGVHQLVGLIPLILPIYIMFTAPRSPGVSRLFYGIALSPMFFLTVLVLLQYLQVSALDIIGLNSPLNLQNYSLVDLLKLAVIAMLFLLALIVGYRTKRFKAERETAMASSLETQQTLIEQLRQTDKLQELDELKTRFYTNITHEFRTPLTVILGMTNQPDNPKASGLIRRNGEKLLHLVNQLLDLAKLNSGGVQANYEQLDVVAYTRYLGESFQSFAGQRDIQLTIYSEVPSCPMDIDPEKYRQIISNLLSNAIKFTAERGRVILHLSRNNNELVLKVTDNGTGISADELPRIFDRFYQVDSPASRQGQGTGIGLALVKELTELMGGNIGVVSEQGSGTTFSVILPIRNVAELRAEPFAGTSDFLPPGTSIAPAASPDQNSEPHLTSEAPANKELPELLLVEDNPDVVQYVVSVLEGHYRVATATDGQAGIERAIELVPDVIVSDVMMPVKTGYELVDTLKKDERTSHVPIILLTAKATMADKLEGFEFGADAYLMKPFEEEELLVRLRQLVETSRRLRDRYQNFQPPSATAPKGPEESFLGKLHKLLEQHFSSPDFGVQSCADALHISHTQLYRKLKALTGKTPSQFLNKFRLEKATALLADPEFNISEVAYAVGFNDPNYFTRVFSQAYGKSPNAYRNG